VAGLLLPGQMLLLSVLFGNPMRMLCNIVQFGGSMVFVRSVLLTKGHFVVTRFLAERHAIRPLL
jgi:hypothetical protein